MKQILPILLLLFTACTKNQLIETNQKFIGGLLPDDPEKVALIPLIVSDDFIKEKKTTEVNPLFRGRPVKDRQPPYVNITSPLNGSNVNGIVTINVTATDNVSVTSVTFSVNGVQKSILYFTPYVFTWDATNVPNGTYSLSVTARDGSNNPSTHTINVIKNVIVVEPPIDTLYGYELKTPPIGNQGSEGSCVGFAVGYAAKSIHEYYKTNATSYDFTRNVFSPEHLYNEIKFSDDCNSGSAMQTGLEFIMRNGILPYSNMEYVSGTCSLKATTEQKEIALNYKIDSFYKMYITDSIAIKSMIRQNNPVIIGIVVDNLFLNAKTGFIWTNTGSGFGFGHCIIICGYDDTKHAWKIMNSFGTSWGTLGYGWIDYDMLPTRSGTYCYAIK